MPEIVGNYKFTMAETTAFSEELSTVIRSLWDTMTDVNVLTAEEFYISSIRLVCTSADLCNLISRTMGDNINDEQAQRIMKMSAIVDCSRHDCFKGDSRYNPEDHTFYDDAVGFIYDGYDLLPQFVNEDGVDIILDPNTLEEDMPNLLDIILAAIQQDTPTPVITVKGAPGGNPPRGMSPNFRQKLQDHIKNRF